MNAAILIGITVLFTSILLGVIFLFLSFNKRKNSLLQQQFDNDLRLQKRYYESELRILQSQLNPHFVHNSLNAIQYYIQRNEVEISEEYLAKFSKLMRLFFDNSRRKTLTLKEEISFLKKYLHIEKLRFEEKLNYRFSIDRDLDIEELEIPSMLLQPMLENAINHGIFHKATPGNLEIIFVAHNDDSGYTVVIKDDGIGIHKAREMNKNRESISGSHSGHVIKERLAILNETKAWDIDHKMVDLSDITKGTGTSITINFNKID